jgi:large conductance mechanosensitive channel
MKKFFTEFKDFIATGNIIEIAVALILALKIKDVIDAFMEGVVNPIIGAIIGKQDLSQLGFDLGDARISIGLVLQALLNLIIVGFVLFVIIRAYNKIRKPEPATQTEIDLLTDIRDSLRSR